MMPSDLALDPTADLPPDLQIIASTIAGSPHALAMLDALLAEGYGEADAVAFVASQIMPGMDPAKTAIGSGQARPGQGTADDRAPFAPSDLPIG